MDRVARGVYRASERGHSVLAEPLERIGIPFLRQFPEFRSLRPNDRYDEPRTAATEMPVAVAEQEATPAERIEDAIALIRADLSEKVLQRLLDAPPAFFEQVVIDLLVAMGYGTSKDAGEVRGRSGDGGIDGVIREDRLGLDLIYA